MAPWLDYPASDPRSGRSNWRLDESTGQPIYVGPPAEGMPNDGTGTLYVPEWTPDVSDPNATWTGEFEAPFVSTNASAQASGYYDYDPLSSAYTYVPPAYDPLSSGNPGNPPPALGPPPQPPYDPLSSAYTPSSAPLITEGIRAGESRFDVDARRQDEYASYLAGQSAPGAVGAAPLASGAIDPVTGAPIASDPYGYDTGYGYDAGYGQEYATDPMTGLPLFPGDEFGSQPQSSPYGFDPFLWAGVKNPMPAPSAMRGQIMQAGGFAGPAWAPAPPPQPPGPMAYVRARLGMQEPGHTLEMKPPVPGFRFDGTPRSEPREESQNFVPADQVGMLPPLPPTFPRRGY